MSFNKTVSILFLVLGLIYFFSKIFFGLDFTDSFYHLNVALDSPSENYPSTFFLSSYIIKGASLFAGKKIIIYRVFNAIIILLSIVIPLISLKRKPSKNDLILISIILILISPLNANILGYDTFSLFFLSLVFSLLILYRRKPTGRKLLLLSLACVLAIFIRLPNLILIPLISLSIFLVHHKSVSSLRLKQPILFVALSIIFIISGYLLQYPGLEGLFDWNNDYHNPVELFKNYGIDAIYVIIYLGVLFLFLQFYKRIKNRNDKVYIILLILAFSLFLFFGVGYEKFSRTYILFLIALTILVVGRQIDYKKELFGKTNFHLSVYLLFLSVLAFGSNTGLIKSALIIVLIPAVFYIRVIRDRIFYTMLLLPLIFFSISINLKNIYEDLPLWYLDKELDEELAWVRTSEIRKEYLQDLEATVDSLKDEGIEVHTWGNKSHIINYLYPGSALSVLEFFQPLDTDRPVRELENKSPNSPKALILSGYYPVAKSSDSIYYIEEELIENGFTRLNNSRLRIYWKK